MADKDCGNSNSDDSKPHETSKLRRGDLINNNLLDCEMEDKNPEWFSQKNGTSLTRLNAITSE